MQRAPLAQLPPPRPSREGSAAAPAAAMAGLPPMLEGEGVRSRAASCGGAATTPAAASRTTGRGAGAARAPHPSAATTRGLGSPPADGCGAGVAAALGPGGVGGRSPATLGPMAGVSSSGRWTCTALAPAIARRHHIRMLFQGRCRRKQAAGDSDLPSVVFRIQTIAGVHLMALLDGTHALGCFALRDSEFVFTCTVICLGDNRLKFALNSSGHVIREMSDLSCRPWISKGSPHI